MYNMLFETNTVFEESDCEFGQKYVDHYKMTMPVFTGFGNWFTGLMAQFTERYNIVAIPTTVIILPNQQDPANSIVKIIEGAGSWDYETNKEIPLSTMIRDSLATGGFYSSWFKVIGSLCSNPPYSLTLSSPSATGNLWSTGATTQNITINAPGEYSLTIEDGCTYTDTIEFIPLPVIGTASISSPTVCQDGAVTFSYSLPEGSPDDLTWVSRGVGETEWNDFYPANHGPFQLITANYYPAGSMIEFAVRGSNGSCSEYSNIVTLTVTDEQAGVLTGAVTGPANPVCSGSNFTLNYTGGVLGAYWAILNTEGIWEIFASADQAINPQGLTNLNRYQTGSDQFRVKYEDGDCFSYSDIITVNYIFPSLQITGPSLTCGGTNLVLALNGSYSNILWSTSATTPSITVNPPVTTTYTVTATEQNGCIFTAQHKVKIWEKVSPVIQSSAPGTVCGSGSVTLSFTGTNIAEQCMEAPYGQWPEAEFSVSSCNGNLETITTDGYLGEFSLVNVMEGKYYKFFSSGADEIVNLITNLDGSQVYAGGVFSAIWKATFTGQVLFITNGAECYFSQNVAIIRSVACSSDPSAFGSFVWSNGQTTSSITVTPATTTNYTLSFVQADIPCNGIISSTKQVVVGIASMVLSTTNVTCNSATFNWSTPYNPTQWELEYKSTTNGSKWINVPIAGVSTRSITVTGLKLDQNYQWHIRAKCGKSTTPNSDLVLFKTLVSCGGSLTSRSVDNATAKIEVKSIEDDLKAVAIPNPSNTNFRVAIGGVNNLKEPIKIIVTDMMGRVVEIRSATAGQTITIGDRYRSGTYLLRLTQGNKVRQLKLVKVTD
jgi:hypothetical protein